MFDCKLCNKAYARQVDYENHLGSYDHTHRERVDNAKKLTAANESDLSRPTKGGIDMRNLPDSGKMNKMAGTKFTAAAGVTKWKKVTRATASPSSDANNATAATHPAKISIPDEPKLTEDPEDVKKLSFAEVHSLVSGVVSEDRAEPQHDRDVAMGDADDEAEKEQGAEEKAEDLNDVKDIGVDDDESDYDLPDDYDISEFLRCYCDDPNCPGNQPIDESLFEYDANGWVILPEGFGK